MSSELQQNEKRRRHGKERSPGSDKEKAKYQFHPANPFTEGSSPDDVELKFDDGHSLFVSKTFLMYASPVFELMFQSNFRERQSNSITMQGKSFITFLQMLLHIHPRFMKKFRAQSARKIYVVAHEYQMAPVLDSCADVIINALETIPSDEDAVLHNDDAKFDFAFEVLQLAEKYNDSRICACAVKHISQVPMEFIKRHPVYSCLTDSTKNLILESRLEWCETGEFYYENDESYM